MGRYSFNSVFKFSNYLLAGEVFLTYINV